MAERYYVNSPLQPGPVVLRGPEAHHLAAVCRARPGDLVFLFNGDGAEYPAKIAEVGKKQVVLEITGRETPARELGFGLEVAAPVPKGDRGAFLIEKLTELGVTRFTPLRSERSVVHPRSERLERTVIEASKQCGRNVLMEIGPVTEWASYCRQADLRVRKLIAHPGGKPIPQPTNEDIAVAVGPEGGFTADEIQIARDAGWLLVDLGPRVLRVETAAILMAGSATPSSAL
jgi:16S rRNA (uracil1498-N3)-methyltransferase